MHEDRPGERSAERDPRVHDELGDVVAAGGGVAGQREDGGRLLGGPGLRGEPAAVVGFAPSPAGDACLELAVGQVRVLVRAGFDRALLHEVLEVLGARRA